MSEAQRQHPAGRRRQRGQPGVGAGGHRTGREHDALRPAGRAGGQDDDGRRLRVAVRRRPNRRVRATGRPRRSASRRTSAARARRARRRASRAVSPAGTGAATAPARRIPRSAAIASAPAGRDERHAVARPRRRPPASAAATASARASSSRQVTDRGRRRRAPSSSAASRRVARPAGRRANQVIAVAPTSIRSAHARLVDRDPERRRSAAPPAARIRPSSTRSGSTSRSCSSRPAVASPWSRSAAGQPGTSGSAAATARPSGEPHARLEQRADHDRHAALGGERRDLRRPPRPADAAASRPARRPPRRRAASRAAATESRPRRPRSGCRPAAAAPPRSASAPAASGCSTYWSANRGQRAAGARPPSRGPTPRWRPGGAPTSSPDRRPHGAHPLHQRRPSCRPGRP